VSAAAWCSLGRGTYSRRMGLAVESDFKRLFGSPVKSDHPILDREPLYVQVGRPTGHV